MEIKILGPGCARCHQVEKLVKETIAEIGTDANIEHVTDFKKIASYSVFSTPAVVINGEVKSVGKIPKKEDILKWIKK